MLQSLFYSVFNLNQLNSPMYLVFKHKREYLDTIYGEILESGYIHCCEKMESLEPYEEEEVYKWAKCLFKCAKLLLKWDPSLREFLQKPLRNTDDFEIFEKFCKRLGISVFAEIFDTEEETIGYDECGPNDGWLESYVNVQPDGSEENFNRKQIANLTLDEVILTTTFYQFNKLFTPDYVVGERRWYNYIYIYRSIK